MSFWSDVMKVKGTYTAYGYDSIKEVTFAGKSNVVLNVHRNLLQSHVQYINQLHWRGDFYGHIYGIYMTPLMQGLSQFTSNPMQFERPVFFLPYILWIDFSKQPEKTKIDEVIQGRQLILFVDVACLSIFLLFCLFFWMNFHDNGKIVHTSFLSLLFSFWKAKCDQSAVFHVAVCMLLFY